MKNKIIPLVLFCVFLFLGVFAIVMFNRYKAFRILSIYQEYNVVSTQENPVVNVPLYLEKKNSFMSKKENVKSAYIENGSYSFVTHLESIKVGDTIEYGGSKFYEYYYTLSFSSYDDFANEIFMENGQMRLDFANGDSMSFAIGNISLYFNKKADNSGIVLRDLEAVTNFVAGKETIVGLNITIGNYNDSVINLKSVKVNNKFYELDYMSYKREEVPSKTILTEIYDNYDYTSTSVIDGYMNINVAPRDTLTLFIPLKYLNGVRYVSNLPLFISYTLDSEDLVKVVDSFTFISKNAFSMRNGLKEYEYKYN